MSDEDDRDEQRRERMRQLYPQRRRIAKPDTVFGSFIYGVQDPEKLLRIRPYELNEFTDAELSLYQCLLLRYLVSVLDRPKDE